MKISESQYLSIVHLLHVSGIPVSRLDLLSEIPRIVKKYEESYLDINTKYGGDEALEARTLLMGTLGYIRIGNKMMYRHGTIRLGIVEEAARRYWALTPMHLPTDISHDISKSVSHLGWRFPESEEEEFERLKRDAFDWAANKGIYKGKGYKPKNIADRKKYY